MSNGLQEFGFGQDDDAISYTTDKYKGEAGNTDRVSFVWFNKNDEGVPDLDDVPRFVGGPKIYIKGVGSFFVPPKNKDLVAIAKKAGEKPKFYAGTIIAVWPTDKDGKLDSESPRLHKVQVKPWICAADRYRTLKRKHGEFPVGHHDMTLSCIDSQWQKMEIGSCRESIFEKIVQGAAEGKESATAILASINESIEAVEADIGGLIAHDWSADTVREKMGLASGNPDLGGAVSDQAVDDMLGDIIST